MRHRRLASMGALAVAGAVICMAAVTVVGQTATGVKTTPAAKKWTPPRTADGQPDLQGVWANNSATPLQRPKQWAGKQFLTDQELADLKKVSDEIAANSGDAQFGDGLVQAVLEKITKPGSYDPSTGNYNQFWIALQIKNERIYEYACHEGNESMIGILSGHRAAEKDAQRSTSTSGGSR